MRKLDLTYLSDYHDIVKAVIGTDQVTVIESTFSDNVLINGRNDFNCSLAVPGQKCTPNAPLSKFHFTTGQTHILRLINGGSDGYIITPERWPCSQLTTVRTLYFSIDEHQLEVVALDFVPITPYTTTVVSLGVGQRMDVLVKGTGKSTASYYMRARNSQGPGCDEGVHPPPSNSALAIIFYEHAPATKLPSSTAAPFTDNCLDAPITVGRPYRPQAVATENIHTVNIEIVAQPNATGTLLWFENNSTFSTDFSDPVLRDVARGQEIFPAKYNIYDTKDAGTIRFVIVNNSPATHPLHMHG